MKRLLVSAAILFLSGNAYSQTNFWSFVNEQEVPQLHNARYVQPQLYKTLSLDLDSYKTYLSAAPKEFSVPARNGMEISIPYPDNSFQRFRIVETKMMEDGLAAQLPGLKTFTGQGIDDPYA